MEISVGNLINDFQFRFHSVFTFMLMGMSDMRDTPSEGAYRSRPTLSHMPWLSPYMHCNLLPCTFLLRPWKMSTLQYRD